MSNPFRLKRIGGGSTLRGGDGLRGRQGIFPSGSLAASGALVKHLSTSLTGAISTLTGTVVKLVSPTTYTGAISTITSTFSASRVIILELVSGISTITSSLQTQINLSPIGGTIATAGSLVKSLALNAFTGALNTLTGSLVRVRQVFSTFTSSIGLAGSFQSNINLALTGALVSAGTLIKSISLTAFTGAISTLTSSLVSLKLTFLEVAGVISTISGAFQSNINLALTGTIVGAGNLVKSISTSYTGAISTLTGALTKRINLTSVTGSISTLTGALTRIPALNNLTGVISSAGSLTKKINLEFSGAVSTLTGALTKQVAKTLAGVISTITSVGEFERLTPPATITLTALSITTITMTTEPSR